MSLQTQKDALFAPQEGTLPVSVKALDDAGFHICVMENKYCSNAVAIHPHRDPAAIMLCCKDKGRPISAEQAFGCTQQA